MIVAQANSRDTYRLYLWLRCQSDYADRSPADVIEPEYFFEVPQSLIVSLPFAVDLWYTVVKTGLLRPVSLILFMLARYMYVSYSNLCSK
jgi:hypothetical protein